MTDLILYTTEDGRSQIKLRAKDETVWLTQLEMAELFASSKQNIGQHLKSIFEEGELVEASVVKQHFTTAADGKDYSTKLYNLDAILAVGYRVRSPRGVQFRRWASTVLKEFLFKGFVMDDERLKNPDGRPDYFDEMLERIRDIRASEKRFYQKVRDLFALSSDYDKTDKATQVFFATAQNLLIFAVTRKTAAELITARANPADPRWHEAGAAGATPQWCARTNGAWRQRRGHRRGSAALETAAGCGGIWPDRIDRRWRDRRTRGKSRYHGCGCRALRLPPPRSPATVAATSGWRRKGP
jgi:hypothetical protein